MVEVSRETPGNVVDWQSRDLGADSAAVYQERDEQVQTGGLVQAYHGLGSSVNPQNVVAGCRKRNGEGGPRSVRLVQITEAVAVVGLTLPLSGEKELKLVKSSWDKEIRFIRYNMGILRNEIDLNNNLLRNP